MTRTLQSKGRYHDHTIRIEPPENGRVRIITEKRWLGGWIRRSYTQSVTPWESVHRYEHYRRKGYNEVL